MPMDECGASDGRTGCRPVRRATRPRARTPSPLVGPPPERLPEPARLEPAPLLLDGAPPRLVLLAPLGGHMEQEVMLPRPVLPHEIQGVVDGLLDGAHRECRQGGDALR